MFGGCRTSSAPTAAVAPPTRYVSAEAKLKELKIELPPPGPPSATLVPIVVAGNLAFVSGHISKQPDGALIVGRVGEDLDVTAGRVAAREVGLAILSTLRQELGTLNRVKRVVKVLGMVNCPPGFKETPVVINGCSELFMAVFGNDRGKGARSAVGMNALPSNVAVEIEAIFEID
jgi:enamine deaminase RidA (YjgF/YER057c/UK114 family)